MYNQVTFMSSYGATSLEEDFAELFSHAFVRHNEGQGLAHRLLNGERRTSLGKKLEFIEKMLPMYLSDTQAAVGNLHRAFTAPYSLYYQDVKLAGERLEYIGYAAPRFVLSGIMSHYGLKLDDGAWLADIGGWQVKATDGNYYLIFPGGYCDRISKPFTVAA